MSADERHKPGQICEVSGQYPIYNADGDLEVAERTVTKGEPFPPLPKGFTYGAPDVTKHGRLTQSRKGQPRG